MELTPSPEINSPVHEQNMHNNSSSDRIAQHTSTEYTNMEKPAEIPHVVNGAENHENHGTFTQQND